MKNKLFLFLVTILAATFAWFYLTKKPSLKISTTYTASLNDAKSDQIKVLLFLALPGSGKSEVRTFLASLPQKERIKKFGIGETVEFDDFPYVFFMRRVSDELTARKHEGMFFRSPALPFREARDWGVLIHLVNEDYEDVITQNKPVVDSAAEWLFDRIDAARKKVGAEPEFKTLSIKLRKEIANAVEKDAQKILNHKIKLITENPSLDKKTVIIEFSRGGADASPMPLPAPHGYRYSLEQLHPDILKHTSILYIWVTPEESRRKNEARVDPKDPGSILNHCVPRAVMFADYGCDDIDWLTKTSGKPNTIKINTYGKTYYLPVGKFDNRVDQTTFVHKKHNDWDKKEINSLRKSLNDAFKPLV
jgi:hypothetical protein